MGHQYSVPCHSPKTCISTIMEKSGISLDRLSKLLLILYDLSFHRFCCAGMADSTISVELTGLPNEEEGIEEDENYKDRPKTGNNLLVRGDEILRHSMKHIKIKLRMPVTD